jgi:Leucine-rich repeat (LRR) protein
VALSDDDHHCFIEIGECIELTTLDLQHNELVDVPDSFGKLTSLVRLGLRYNKLASLPTTLACCHRLEEFIIEGNQLTSLPVCEFNCFNISFLFLLGWNPLVTAKSQNNQFESK